MLQRFEITCTDTDFIVKLNAISGQVISRKRKKSTYLSCHGRQVILLWNSFSGNFSWNKATSGCVIRTRDTASCLDHKTRHYMPYVPCWPSDVAVNLFFWKLFMKWSHKQLCYKSMRYRLVFRPCDAGSHALRALLAKWCRYEILFLETFRET